MPYHVFGMRSGAVARMSLSTSFASARSAGAIFAIASRTAVSPSVFSLSSRARAFIAAFSSAVKPFSAAFVAVFRSAIASHLHPLEDCVDAREAALCALLDAVFHRRVALLSGLETHRQRQLRLLAQLF